LDANAGTRESLAPVFDRPAIPHVPVSSCEIPFNASWLLTSSFILSAIESPPNPAIDWENPIAGCDIRSDEFHWAIDAWADRIADA
jgi:hypothetical protein